MTRILAFLKGVPPMVYVVVGVLTVAGASLAAYGAHQRRIGALNAEIVQYEHDNRTLRMAQDSLAAAYRPQAVTAAKTRIKWDTVKAGLDTAWLHDTIPVPVEVVRTVVLVADSAVKSCTQALSTCEQRVGVAEKGWAGARSEIAAIKASYPSKSQKWFWLLGGAASGAVIGYIAHP